ncbi:Uncharacterised protein [Mycobacterium tuberculosis]|nr:Uncharacterised protein [Mycobacterium tuberculosis]
MAVRRQSRRSCQRCISGSEPTGNNTEITLPTPSHDTTGTATLGIVSPKSAGVCFHSVNATATAKVGTPTITSRVRFFSNSTRQNGAPCDSPLATRW